MFVTTAGRTNEKMIEKAKMIADDLGVSYIPRHKQSVVQLQNKWNSACLVVGKNRLELYEKGSAEPFFFHPNSAMFRIKRLMQGDHDPFADAAGLKNGMSLLDCTLGLASDAIVASWIAGSEGKVTGIEGQPSLTYIVKEGLQTWDSGLSEMNEAMQRIEVENFKALDFLRRQPDASFDIVYFDPMFEESIVESVGIKALGRFALYTDLDEETIREAIRVAKHRVVLKDHYQTSRFETYGFNEMRRKTAKFHFGFIEK